MEPQSFPPPGQPLSPPGQATLPAQAPTSIPQRAHYPVGHANLDPTATTDSSGALFVVLGIVGLVGIFVARYIGFGDRFFDDPTFRIAIVGTSVLRMAPLAVAAGAVAGAVTKRFAPAAKAFASVVGMYVLIELFVIGLAGLDDRLEYIDILSWTGGFPI